MKKELSIARGIGLFTFVLILFSGIYFIKAPSHNSFNNNKIIHTYLVKIPADAGICPYALMSRTHGKLKMVNDTHCTCPYAEHALYMTTRCTSEQEVIAMLPSSLQNKVQIKVVDNIHKTENKKLTKGLVSASF